MDNVNPFITTVVEAEAIRAFCAALRRKVRHGVCYVWNWGHDTYVTTDPETKRIFVKCVLCDYESKGITLERRLR